MAPLNRGAAHSSGPFLVAPPTTDARRTSSQRRWARTAARACELIPYRPARTLLPGWRAPNGPHPVRAASPPEGHTCPTGTGTECPEPHTCTCSALQVRCRWVRGTAPNPSPGSCSHCPSDEDLPGEGRLPKDTSLDLHPPLRFRENAWGIVTSGAPKGVLREGGRGPSAPAGCARQGAARTG